MKITNSASPNNVFSVPGDSPHRAERPHPPQASKNPCVPPRNGNGSIPLRDKAATLIQKRYKEYLQRRPFPQMLCKTGQLKPLPRLVKSRNGNLTFGARPLTISGRSLGKGAYGNVYAGTYNNHPVAVKIGELPELKHIDKLLAVQKQVAPPIVIPYPVAISEKKGPRGIAIMPRMTCDLKKHLRNHPEQIDRRRCEQYRISDQLVGCGVYHMDQTPENFLLDGNGKLYLSDFGCIRVDRTQAEPVYAATTSIEDVLPRHHPFLTNAKGQDSHSQAKQKAPNFFLEFLAGLRVISRLF